MTFKQQSLLVGVLVLCAFGLMFMRQQASHNPPLSDLFHDLNPTPVPVEETYIYVDIRGEVLRPGVYKMKTGERLFHLIHRAGGLSDGAWVDTLNQAQRLDDGMAYRVLHLNAQSQGELTPPIDEAVEAKININTASVERLSSLPGIGPSTASNIVNHREAHGPFATIDDLLAVRNVGPNTLEALRDLITV